MKEEEKEEAKGKKKTGNDDYDKCHCKPFTNRRADFSLDTRDNIYAHKA